MSLWQYLVLFLIIGLVALANLGREAAEVNDQVLRNIKADDTKEDKNDELMKKALKPLEVFK